MEVLQVSCPLDRTALQDGRWPKVTTIMMRGCICKLEWIVDSMTVRAAWLWLVVLDTNPDGNCSERHLLLQVRELEALKSLQRDTTDHIRICDLLQRQFKSPSHLNKSWQTTLHHVLRHQVIWSSSKEKRKLNSKPNIHPLEDRDQDFCKSDCKKG